MPRLGSYQQRLSLLASLALSVGGSIGTVDAQVTSWAAPVSGFYETPANWDPVGVPAFNDTVVFALPGEYSVGFEGAVGAENLTVANDADIDFNVAGASLSSRLLRLTGDASIDEAKLRLLGNVSGPQLNVVLDGDVELFGGPDTLQIVDNAVLLNRSTTIDVDGSIPVTGALAHWGMSANLFVRGGAQLSVTEGASVTSQGGVLVGGASSDDTSTGSLLVAGVGDDGAPSTFEFGDDFFLGRHGTGQLFIRDGGLVEVAGTLLAAPDSGSFAGMVVEGVDASGDPTTLNTNRMTLGNGGVADLLVRSGGLVNSEHTTIAGSSLAMVELIGGDHPTVWDINGSLRMSEGGRGQLIVDDGAILRSGDAFFGVSISMNDAAVIVLTGDDAAPTSVWENRGDAYLGGNEFGARSPATLSIDGNAAADVAGKLTIWEEGAITIDDGGALSADVIDHTNGGDFRLNGGSLSANRFEGDLTNLGGSLAPGTDGGAGATLVTGDYSQHSNGRLAIGVGGTSPGGTHDLVNVLGGANLDGLFEAHLLDGFIPDASDVFTVLAADTLIGFFDNVTSGQRLDTSDGRGSFVVNYGIGSAFDETRIVLTDFVANAVGLPGDFNGDGAVDLLDLDILGANFGLSGTTLATGDANGDGTTDLLDLDILGANFGLSALGAAVPEPTAIGLMLMSALFVSRRCRLAL